MASNPESRARFAEQCVELIKNYNFDGIDIGEEDSNILHQLVSMRANVAFVPFSHAAVPSI